MGFFDWLSKKNGKTKEKDRLEIKFSELDGWLNKKLEEKKSKTYEKTRPLVDDVFKISADIRKLVLDLDNMKFSKETPERVKKILLTSKPNFVKSMSDSLQEFAVDKPVDYPGVKRLHDGLVDGLEGVGKALGGHGRYLPLAFGDKLTEIQKEVKKLLKKSDEMGEILKEDDETKSIRKSLEDHSRITAIDGDISNIKEAEKNLKEKIKKHEEEKKSLEKSYETIDDTGVSEIKSRRDDVAGKIRLLESGIYEHITPLKRVFRKFRKLVEGGYPAGRVLVRDVDECISNPVGYFLVEENKVRDVLTELRNAVSGRKIEVDENEARKVMLKIGVALDYLTDDLRGSYLKLGAEDKLLSEEISSSDVIAKKKGWGDRITLVVQNIGVSGSELESLGRKRKDFMETREGLVDALCIGLSDLDGREVILI